MHTINYDDAIERVMAFSYELNRDKTRTNARNLILSRARFFGFEGGSMFYGTLAQHEFIDTRPSAFLEAVTEEALINVDPVAHITMQEQKGFLWNERIDPKLLSRSEVEFLGIASEFGVVDGVQIPYKGRGKTSGVLSFYGPYKDNAKDVWSVHQFELYQYAVILFQFCEDIGMADNVGVVDKGHNPLSRNEQRALFAASRSMVYSDIAAIMGINTETVKSHLKNARTKLGADNTAGAVAHALRSGYIL